MPRLVFDYGGRIMLSGIVVIVLIGITSLLRLPFMLIDGVAGTSHRERATASPKPHPRQSQPATGYVYWPRPLVGSKVATRSFVLNGVTLLTEEWESALSPSDAIAYYADHMAARGWGDTTEDFFNVAPENRDDGIVNNGLQDAHYVDTYRKVKASYLVLRRGLWTIYITAEPSANSVARSSIKILAASTPSIKDFSLTLASAFAEPAVDRVGRTAVDALEQQADARYRTIITVRHQEPGSVFAEMLGQCHQQNWRSLTQISDQQGYFAWLVRGESYAALSVVALSKGRSSVTFTEVTPEKSM